MSGASLTCAVSSALELTVDTCPLEIVPKQVISDRQAYMKLLARLHEMYVELNNDNISGLLSPFLSTVLTAEAFPFYQFDVTNGTPAFLSRS